MNTYGDFVGANGGSEPEVASQTVSRTARDYPRPAYGYIRAGYHEGKVYLHNSLEDARGWFAAIVSAPAQPYEYAAVFAAADLSRPVPGLESYGHTTVSGDAYVGNFWPFLLGLPLGALGGYFYRGWQEKHPGHWIPGIAGDYVGHGSTLGPRGSYDYSVGGLWHDMAGPEAYVGGPWVDLAGPQVGGPWLDMVSPQVGGPWLDMVGPEDNIGPYVGAEEAWKRAWPQTKALIASAKREAMDAQAASPSAAWVWSLDADPSRYGMTFTSVTPFPSVDQAQAYMFERIHTPHVAIALFDTAARGRGGWPHPVRWTQNDNPAYEPLIAQHVAQFAPSRSAVGAYASAAVGAALDDVKARAQALASRRDGQYIGVIHSTEENHWRALAFGSMDDADDWLESATKDPKAYTYAAIYDKGDPTLWPRPYIEKIGGLHEAPVRRGRGTQRDYVGASAYDPARRRAQALADARPGNAVGVILRTDGSAQSVGFQRLDDAVDWLQTVTRERTSFSYAAIYEKDADGKAYVQGEEFGGSREVAPPGPLIRRGPGTISGRWAA